MGIVFSLEMKKAKHREFKCFRTRSTPVIDRTKPSPDRVILAITLPLSFPADSKAGASLTWGHGNPKTSDIFLLHTPTGS